MDLLTPSIFKTLNLEYNANEIEKTSAQIIIENIIESHKNVKEVSFEFDQNNVETFDNYVYNIIIDEVRFNDNVVTFDRPVRITVSNNINRKMNENCRKVVYSTKFDLFRNEEGLIIKYYPYKFE